MAIRSLEAKSYHEGVSASVLPPELLTGSRFSTRSCLQSWWISVTNSVSTLTPFWTSTSRTSVWTASRMCRSYKNCWMTSDSSRRRRGPFCATLCLRRNVASSSTRCSIPRRSQWRQWWGSFSFWERSSLWYLEFSLVCLFVGDCVWRWFSFDPKSYECHCKYKSTYFYQPKGDEASFSFTTCFECPFYSLYTKIQSTYPLHENPRSV